MREDFVLGRRPRVGLRLHFGEDAPLLIEIERDINRKRERERHLSRFLHLFYFVLFGLDALGP